MNQQKLSPVPITLREAQAYVDNLHRHHTAPRGHKFSIGCQNELGELVGVVIVGRPVARNLDDGWTAEVTRTCTDGSENVNSCLYGAARRAAKAMGYKRLITYTQSGESGVSLKAAGWTIVATLAARPGWDCNSRDREDKGVDNIQRFRWETK